MTRQLFSATVLLASCGVICVMSSCLGKTTLRAEQVSPTGSYRAELRDGDTGAVGDWMSAIRVSEVRPSVWARLLGREGDTIFGAYLRSTRISFAWKKEDCLQITCDGCGAADIQLRKDSWRGVTISYDLSAMKSRA